MILSLHISNYALISKIDIEFGSGFNIITGETGAGKSIILGALSLLLGGRADIRAVRDTSRKSIIEAVFAVKSYTGLKTIFDSYDIDWDDDQCILRRELSPAGRSRAFVNDTPVTLQTLRDIAIHLVDIHSQHQNMLLSTPGYQLSIIDNLAGNSDKLRDYTDAYNSYRAALKKFTDTRELIRRNKADSEFLNFQLEQLKEMKLVPGEQESLEQERDLLSNMSQIKEHITGSLYTLSVRRESVLDGISEAMDNLRRLSDVLDEADTLAGRLESARIEIQDIAETLSDYDNNLSADPQRLDDIEERLNRLYSLETKHHLNSSDELITLREQLAVQLEAIENGDETLSQLEDEARRAKKRAMVLAREISENRRRQALTFADELKQRALPLGMKNLRCEIQVTEGKLSPSGIDRVDFLFSFNKNQPLMPVNESASGGEISRLILSVKSIIAEKMQLPSIVFDEVDTGVSGDVANRMGELMNDIAGKIQVITITHLPQVAAKGKTHFKVYKEDDETSTNTHIKRLTLQERIDELALMLSGSIYDPAARSAAQSMLKK